MLAIIIPYYKRTFFEATLQSLAAQICQDFKVYIGDDASPEDPGMLLEKYKGKFDFVYHRFATNLGGISLTQQWERCIALSENEEWIMILGDDDMLGENVVVEFYKNLLEIDQIGSKVVRFATNIKIENAELQIPRVNHPKFETISDFYYRKFKGKTRSSLSEYIFKNEVYRKFKFTEYPLAWHSDDKAWFDFSSESPIFSINDATVSIRISKESISGRTSDKVQKDLARLLFFSEIVEKSLCKFSKKTKLLLLIRYEMILKDQNKMTVNKWFFIIKKHIEVGSFIEILKIFRRMLINRFLK